MPKFPPGYTPHGTNYRGQFSCLPGGSLGRLSIDGSAVALFRRPDAGAAPRSWAAPGARRPIAAELTGTLDLAAGAMYTRSMDKSNLDFSVAPGEQIVSDSRCFVCGMKNEGGLQIRFYREDEKTAVARCRPDKRFMGYDGLVHGGVAGALLDEIMIKAVLGRGKLVVTARMTVSYHKPVRMDVPLTLRGTITEERGRIIETEGVILDEAGEVLTTATGSYVELTGKRRAELEQSLGK